MSRRRGDERRRIGRSPARCLDYWSVRHAAVVLHGVHGERHAAHFVGNRCPVAGSRAAKAGSTMMAAVVGVTKKSCELTFWRV